MFCIWEIVPTLYGKYLMLTNLGNKNQYPVIGVILLEVFHIELDA